MTVSRPIVALAIASLLGACHGSVRTDVDVQTLITEGDTASAIKVLEKRLEKNSEDLEALRLLGQLHAKAGEHAKAVPYLRKATRLDSRDAPTWALLGDSLLATQEAQEAAAAFHSALSNDRSNADYHAKLKSTLEGLGMYEQYVAAVGELLVKGPEDVGLLNDLGKTYLEAAHYRAAADAFLKSIEVDPAQTGIRSLLGLSLIKAGAYAEAADVLAEAEREEPATIAIPRMRGQALYKLSRHKEAAVAFEHALKIDRNDPESLAGMALNYHAMGRDSEAMRLLSRGTARSKDSEVLWLAQGRIALDQKQWTTARSAIEKALKLNDKSAEGHLLMGVLLTQQVRHPKAQSELELSRQLDPSQPEVHFRLAELFRVMHLDTEAMDSVNESLKLDKNYLPAIALKAQLNEQAGRYEEALGGYEKMKRKDRSNPEWLYKTGETSLLLGQTAEAESLAQELVSEFPKDSRGPLLAGRVKQAKGDLEGARQEYKKAARLSPRTSEVARATGDLYRQQGSMKQAETEYRRAVQMDSTNRAAQLALGEVLLAQGRTDQGRAALELVIKLSPNSVEARQAETRLAESQPSAEKPGP